MHGILPVWKPKGYTSHDCVFKIRKWLHIKKVGHTGTLDPEVEGVLPICIGEATKIVPYLTDTDKTYVATMTLGLSTDTEDQTGNITSQQEVNEQVSKEEILNNLNAFVGIIKQQVPLYSAVKVKGKKLYEYARNGEFVERPIREVHIHNIRLIDSTYDKVKKTQDVQFEVACSKGTYIRTLCKDIGGRIGYPAHMSKLIRTAAGSFNESQSIKLFDIPNIIENNEIKSILLPISTGVSYLDVWHVDSQIAEKVLMGQKFNKTPQVPHSDLFRVQQNDTLLAIYRHHENGEEIKPVRVFNCN